MMDKEKIKGLESMVRQLTIERDQLKQSIVDKMMTPKQQIVSMMISNVDWINLGCPEFALKRANELAENILNT